MCCQGLVEPHFGEGLKEIRRVNWRQLDVLPASVCSGSYMAGNGCDWRLLDTLSVETWKLEIQQGYPF